MRKYVAFAASLALVGACDSTDPRVPSAVEVEVESLSLLVGETVTIQARIVDQRGRAYESPPDGLGITWTSSDEGVATVQAGQVVGVGSGEATIQAAAGSLAPAEIQVEVVGSLDVVGSFDLPVIRADDPDGREVHAEISFTYSGHRAGTFAVDEMFAVDELTAADSWAYTFFNPDWDDQDFVALQWRDDGLIDYIEFYVEGAVEAAGQFTVYLGFLVLGFDPATNIAEVDYILELTPGVMTVSSATEGQLAGTFQFTMEVDRLDTPAAAADGGVLRSPRPRPALRR